MDRFRFGRVKVALRQLKAWLTNTGYRPERHYMRGPRRPQAATAAARP